MRKLLGGLVFVAGVGGLGYWGAQSHAARMQQEITQAAGLVAQTTVHGVKTAVNGRDIRVSGIADGVAERDKIVAALHDVNGRRVVVDDLTVLETAKPFSFAATRKDGRSIMQGQVPTEAMRTALAGSGTEGAAALTLAAGAPADWSSAVDAGLGTLSKMDEGAVSLRDTDVRISGIVDTPSDRDALLAGLALPAGYALQNDIETRDDGKPVAFDVAYSAATGANVSGKLPSNLDLAGIAGDLGLTEVSGDARSGLFGDASAARAALAKMKGWLPEFETLTLSQKNDAVSISGAVSPGVNADLVAQVMADDIGPDVALNITPMAAKPADGTTRTNAASGQAEKFASGFWLPNVSFTPNLANCTAQVNGVLERSKINFLSGSANLGPRSLRAINAMSSVMLLCATQGGLTAEIGGHTDSTGSNNFDLSAKRAEAVMNAMIARGIPALSMTAAGYGPSKPIADNATEAGRAANRRTTVQWAQ